MEQILPLIAQHLPEGGRLLDIGCGEGQVARMAARVCGMEAIGVDGAAAQVAVARSAPAGRCTAAAPDVAVHP